MALSVLGCRIFLSDKMDGENRFVVDVVRIVDESDQLEIHVNITQALESIVNDVIAAQIAEQSIEEHDSLNGAQGCFLVTAVKIAINHGTSERVIGLLDKPHHHQRGTLPARQTAFFTSQTGTNLVWWTS